MGNFPLDINFSVLMAVAIIQTMNRSGGTWLLHSYETPRMDDLCENSTFMIPSYSMANIPLQRTCQTTVTDISQRHGPTKQNRWNFPTNSLCERLDQTGNTTATTNLISNHVHYRTVTLGLYHGANCRKNGFGHHSTVDARLSCRILLIH